MPHEDPDDPEEVSLRRARIRGKRLALGVVIAVAAAFIGSSAVQIVSTVFGTGIAPLPAGQLGSEERTCALGVRELKRALDRASGRMLSSVAAVNGDEAVAAFRQGLSPDWEQADRVKRACAGAREGLEAWGALQRLLIAEEQLARRAGMELAPLRRDVIAHLPTDLR